MTSRPIPGCGTPYSPGSLGPPRATLDSRGPALLTHRRALAEPRRSRSQRVSCPQSQMGAALRSTPSARAGRRLCRHWEGRGCPPRLESVDRNQARPRRTRGVPRALLQEVMTRERCGDHARQRSPTVLAAKVHQGGHRCRGGRFRVRILVPEFGSPSRRCRPRRTRSHG